MGSDDASLQAAVTKSPCFGDECGTSAATEDDTKACSRPVLLGAEGRGTSRLAAARKSERQERAGAKLGLQSSRGGKHGCTMVCHHWRSKGWCRLGAECKFLHPEEKCGASLVQRNSRGLFGNPRARGTHRVSDLTCSPPTNFVAFPPGGFFSAVHMPGVPTVPTQMSPSEGYFVLAPSF